MAITPFKTFSAGEVLTASDLNSSITTITDGGMSQVSPATAALDMNGLAFILDVDADTQIIADTDDLIDFTTGGSSRLLLGAGLYTAAAVGGDKGADNINAVKYHIGTVFWSTGTGTPESAVTAPVGSLFSRTDGGGGTTLYVKETGSGNTGWAAM